MTDNSDQIRRQEEYKIFLAELHEHDRESQESAVRAVRELLVGNPHKKEDFKRLVWKHRNDCHETAKDAFRKSFNKYCGIILDGNHEMLFPHDQGKDNARNWPQYFIRAAFDFVQKQAHRSGEKSFSLSKERLLSHRNHPALSDISNQAVRDAATLRKILEKLNSYNLIDKLDLEWDNSFLHGKENRLRNWVESVFDESKIAKAFDSKIAPIKIDPTREETWLEALHCAEQIRSITKGNQIRIAVPNFDPVIDFTLKYLKLNYLGNLIKETTRQMTTDVVDECILRRTSEQPPFHFMIAGCSTYLLNAGRDNPPQFQFCGAPGSIPQLVCSRQESSHNGSGICSILTRSTGMGVYLTLLQERVDNNATDTKDESELFKEFIEDHQPLVAKKYMEFNTNNMRVPLGKAPDSNLNCAEFIYAWDPVADDNADVWKLERDESGEVSKAPKSPFVGLFSNEEALNEFKTANGSLTDVDDLRQLFCRLYMICSQLFLFHPLLKVRSDNIVDQLAQLSADTPRYPN